MREDLERIVPSVDLCRRIPGVEFEFSALTWLVARLPGHTEAIDAYVCERGTCKTEDFGGVYQVFPAPTAQEILDSLAYRLYFPRVRITTAAAIVECEDINLDDVKVRDENLAEAALRMWLRLETDEENEGEEI